MAKDHETTELLQEYLQADSRLREGRHAEFTAVLKQLAASDGPQAARPWARRAVSPLADYSWLMKLRRWLPTDAESDGKIVRLAILGGPTTVQLRRLIEVFLAAEEIAAEIYECDYGLFRQEVMTAGSGLDAFQPQVIFFATGARDVARFPAIGADADGVAQLAADELADWMRLWETAHSKWRATIIQNNFEISPDSILGHHNLRHAAAREHYLDRLNRLLAERAPRYVLLHDVRGLAAEVGARSWFDPRFYWEFKMPCGAECLTVYAHSVVSLLRAIAGRSKKVLVLDLDNTLWGGVVGDVGAGGIRLGQGSGEGEAFLAFQRHAKSLSERGILLAVCSKNDLEKAREPFETREDMVLRLSDIACFVANWENKANNLRVIADRLNLKTDSFVFVDDNPAERALVRRFLPEVAVPDMPDDPAGYIQALSVHRYFETVGFTGEDAARGTYYAQNAQRQELAAGAADVGSFLGSLGMRMRVRPVNALNLERATQLVNKSNQFNLTTRRYAATQMRDMATCPDWRTLTFSLQDNLGDNGLIGVILARPQANSLVIDTWVMSCRVLQRGVEHFARNALVRLARQEGCDRIVGSFIPSPKNAMVKDHFANLGFEPAGSEEEQTFWTLRVDAELAPLDHHILEEADHE